MPARRLLAVFLVTLASFGLWNGCSDDAETDEDDETNGTGTGTGIGTTDTNTGTDVCEYHEAENCAEVVVGEPCEDSYAYCLLPMYCGHYPTLEDRYVVCFDDWGITHGNFDPTCPTNTMTMTGDPPAECPCTEPEAGTTCAFLFGQRSPCAYAECEQWVCDPVDGVWVLEETCR